MREYSDPSPNKLGMGKTLLQRMSLAKEPPLAIAPFQAANPDHFAANAPQFRDLLQWDSGSLWALINSESAYQQMAAFTLRGLPAVASITHHLDLILEPIDSQAETDDAAGALAHRLRRAIGSMIRAVMEANGFRKTGVLRAVPPEPRRLFAKAEVYERIPVGEAMAMANDQFPWDQHALGASFASIRKLAPHLSIRALPSMYSPDRRWFYLSSLDIDVLTTDEEELRLLLPQLKLGYQSALDNNPKSHLRLAAYRGDFIEVCMMLSDLATDPDEFADPDTLLDT
ncbi:hypothetical protein [Stenotrophomonas maltophilia]|uniref:hypothetical protein n=1 Tax=Stenotrophomonas maltophilia TaxID=40324 RepID=UPI0021C56CCE|nr:hypothetical protein [Stenotrophomonas maltophilia]MCU1137064.1 hypothetical protein [Stenotrophomonas maltophilia]